MPLDGCKATIETLKLLRIHAKVARRVGLTRDGESTCTNEIARESLRSPLPIG
jgi:hypothetical protein